MWENMREVAINKKEVCVKFMKMVFLLERKLHIPLFYEDIITFNFI